MGKEPNHTTARKPFSLSIIQYSFALAPGVHKEMSRLSWLTNSALVALRGLSQWVQLCTWSSNKLWRSNSIFDLWLILRVSAKKTSPIPYLHNFFYTSQSRPLPIAAPDILRLSLFSSLSADLFCIKFALKIARVGAESVLFWFPAIVSTNYHSFQLTLSIS